MEKYFCDKCKKEINEEPQILKVKTFMFHLCSDCIKDLGKWLNTSLKTEFEKDMEKEEIIFGVIIAIMSIIIIIGIITKFV